MGEIGEKNCYLVPLVPLVSIPNAQCPMPNAQCPMPNAPCPMPHAQSSVNTLFHLSPEADEAVNIFD
ncbi:hypothetical protein [Nostoc linckia]|uniref:hypothetical protein n=1 Tax=Nostoc linckia TaxID=92942 RepID=UPI0015D475E2|nr:hypothetical protein [Nostoc linckia]